jgi:pescadillo protein
LQISLKDFRRLCILKGIYPRAPKKVAHGRDKTYYHVKDIKFLQYEPVLQKFRQLKTYLKKYNRLKARGEFYDAKKMQKTKPKVVVDHLIKERYPQFINALADLDDPLSMIALFSVLPSGITGSHTAERVQQCSRLSREWEIITARMHALEKVFVSIKGTYYQVRIQGQDITWLVPHQAKQNLPSDVDYRVMLTFLQFYEAMVKFVNFKLFHDEGLHYPPRLDEAKEAKRLGVHAIEVSTLEQHRAQQRHKEQKKNNERRP